MEKNNLKEVILVTSDEKSRNYKWENNASSLSNLLVLSEDYNKEGALSEINFIGRVNNKEQVFVKDPFYKDTYVEISKAEDRIFKNKIRFYKRIALLLGANSFVASAEFVEENKATMDANGTVSYNLVEISAAVSQEHSSKFNKKYELSSSLVPLDNFDRNRAFQEANSLVRELKLQNEIDIVGLIENNDPTLQSRETKQKVKLELTNELNDLLEIAFNINAMGGVFGLGANFKKTTESMKKIILETEIVF